MTTNVQPTRKVASIGLNLLPAPSPPMVASASPGSPAVTNSPAAHSGDSALEGHPADSR